MADHFGKNYDLNGNGRADLPNTFSYVNPSQGYEVTLDATDTKVPVNLAPASYTWKITDASGRSQTHAGIKPTLALQEGAYSVELTVRSGQFRQTTRESIQVDNIFIVSIGDSYASGEGNPEIDAQWKWGYDEFNHFGRIIKKHASWADAGISSESEKIGKEHAEAHRSTLSAPAQAAMALEYLDKHTSVTFVSLAASGATINDLILNVHGDADEYDQVLRPQLIQLQEIANGREIDALSISIGGNDIGFARIVRDLVENDDFNPFDKSKDKIRQEISTAFAQLPDKFRALDDAIQQLPAHGVRVGKVFISQYPDPTRNSNGDFQSFLEFEEYLVNAQIDRSDAEFAVKYVLDPLNAHVQWAKREFDWMLIDGIDTLFAKNGYPSDNPWIVTAEQSRESQGPIWSRETTKGTLHPNAQGHKKIAEIMNSGVFGMEMRDLMFDRGPKVTSSTHWIMEQPSRLGYQSLIVEFQDPIQSSTFSPGDVSIRTSTGVSLPVIAVQELPESNQQRFQIVFGPADAGNFTTTGMSGSYSLAIGTDILSLTGRPMNQNGDEHFAQRIGSREVDQYNSNFTIVAPIHLVNGTLIIEGSDQADVVLVTLVAGNTVQVSLAPRPTTIVNPLADIHPNDAWDAMLATYSFVTFAAADVQRIVFIGRAGNDSFTNDTAVRASAYGGEGDDILIGGEGSDVLYGNDGADTLNGRGGCDELFGGLGNDQMSGGNGADWLYGEGGHDSLDGGLDADVLEGGYDNDSLEGGSGDDTLRGGFGNDALYGGDGIDWLFGDAGDDYLDGGLGAGDQLVGGSGQDTFRDWYYFPPKSAQNPRPSSQRVREDVILDYVFGEDMLRFSNR